jgi:PAS domain S-box-containing protein
MDTSEDERGRFAILRQRAEEALQGQPVDLHDLSPDDFRYLLHELQVHQAELHMQNEELRQVQLELEASRDRYANLYHFAPAGYCTINRQNRILEANQTLTLLLGVERDQLLDHSLTDFIAREDQDKYFLHLQRAFEKRQPRANEIQLQKPDGEKFYVRIESRVAPGKAEQLWVMVYDITKERKLQHHLLAQREQFRQKIAHDLHDGPVQALAAINFALHGLAIDYPDHELAKMVEAIQASVREQIQELRNYAVDLRPPILDQLGLEKSLQSYLESFLKRHPGLKVRMEIHPINGKLSEAESTALFRIFQEALMNIAKHAGTKDVQVQVTLREEGQLVRLEIQDNGKGFDIPDQWLDFAQAGHLGILGMQERAEAMGGQLDLQSTGGKGTRMMATIPLRGNSLTKEN